MKQNIKLIITDLDGCLSSQIGAELDVDSLLYLKNTLKEKNILLTFCTGRPRPYVEMLMQVFGTKIPSICEHGGIIFDSVLHKTFYTDPEFIQQIRKYENIIKEKIIGKFPVYIESGKSTCIGIIPNDFNDNNTISSICSLLKNIKDLFPKEIHYHVASQVINILPISISKQIGVKKLLEMINISSKQVLAIGDSAGDLGFMQFCGFSACPANSDQILKDKSDYVSTFNDIKGILDIVEKFTS